MMRGSARSLSEAVKAGICWHVKVTPQSLLLVHTLRAKRQLLGSPSVVRSRGLQWLEGSDEGWSIHFGAFYVRLTNDLDDLN